MKILDTTFLIDLMRGKPETLKVISDNKDLVTTQINIYEILAGLFYKKILAQKYHKIIDMFQDLHYLPLDENGTIKGAQICAELIERGQIIEDKDCMIAGIALSKNIPIIITKNKKDFERIKGIKVETY